jgi:hypothetical protein
MAPDHPRFLGSSLIGPSLLAIKAAACGKPANTRNCY